ncbi:hypothetical protein ACIA8O_05585 [Kitasatospora sp. NPDC051853]|uniref:hypothetical protein n=1 Tax=Kitasatospora sp. NPDC051853 TaxID=3364058 RepID=UPI00378F0B83
MTIAEMHILADPKADRIESWDVFLTPMQASSALFTAAGLAEGDAECRIAGAVRTIPTIGSADYTDVESGCLPKHLVRGSRVGEFDA